MIDSLDKSENKTIAKHKENVMVSREKKPSLAEKLNENKERIRQKDLEKLLLERTRVPGVEV